MYFAQFSATVLMVASLVSGGEWSRIYFACLSSNVPQVPTQDPSAPYAKIHTVVVGSTNIDMLMFTPQEITAQPGDQVEFQFSEKNHTVTQSAFDTPCEPIANAINSGFVPATANQSVVWTFTMTVENTAPMFMYCAQGNHCQAGMVFTINAMNGTQNYGTYREAAAKAPNNVLAAEVSGGVFGKIVANEATTVPLRRFRRERARKTRSYW
ncbi:hypothetical protein NHQ30_010464 [Ciborinia camelliae]|nr:hypothetical protein NHQ30_010464 [Ciborinia camelliae]